MSSERIVIAEKAVQQTGDRLRELFQSGKYSEKMKADRTLVTAADREADQMVEAIISERYPKDGILSEEKSTVFPETEHAWVVDPLDGTVNFSHGLVYWGVSLAHMKDGIPENGAIYFPMLNELYTASRGRGAALNGKPLHLNDQEGKDLFPVFVHCSRMHHQYRVKTRYKKRSLGAAAYHICLVAKSGAVLALESTPRIWDFAAGWLIVEEAGGAIQVVEGDDPFPAQPGIDYASRPYPILAAGNSTILAEALDGIIPT
jgi:myo-inositol-1(or 4)-monophosphatase